MHDPNLDSPEGAQFEEDHLGVVPDATPRPKPPTRRFFRKAVPPPPKPPCESHRRKYPKRQLAISEMANPLTGARMVRRTDAGWAMRKIAASKAGKASQASGKANRFTSETGSEASKKLWSTRQRKVKGIRIGHKLAGRKKHLNRIHIRTLYTNAPKHGIRFVNAVDFKGICLFPAHWERTVDGVTTRISERTALLRLGYMQSKLTFVPTSVRLLPVPGTLSAVGTGESLNPLSGESE